MNRPQPTEALSESERATLAAAIDRILPDDDGLPGALAARADQYLVRALLAERSGYLSTYHDGLSRIEQRSMGVHHQPFSELSAKERDRLLEEIAHGEADWFAEGGAEFFSILRAHAIEGTFSDPRWGGNADRIGWAMIGYGGPRLEWLAEEQRVSYRDGRETPGSSS